MMSAPNTGNLSLSPPANALPSAWAALSPSAREPLSRARAGDDLSDVLGELPRRVVETHVSLVLAGERRVLKFKKPVDLGFVDHRTLAARWRSACQEVHLNARLIEGVYLGLEVFFKDGRRESLPPDLADPRQSPPEGAVEVAVVMRTLDEKRFLSSLIASGEASAERHIQPLAERVARFHQRQIEAARAGDGPAVSFERIEEGQILDNFAVLRQRAGDILSPAARHALAKTEEASRAFLRSHRAALEERIREGFVVDGHGDLRAEHVCFAADGTPGVYDCVEFSDELREEDILSDAAFLRMDLDFLGRGDLAEAFVRRYAEALSAALSEGFDAELLDFFASYRAMVRAKIEILGALQGSDAPEKIARAEEFLALASRYARRLPQRVLIAVGGLMGSGKSSLAGFLEKQLRAEWLGTDALRREGGVSSAEGRQLGYGAGAYSAAERLRVYDVLLRRAEDALGRGVPVLLDATFSFQSQRTQAAELAQRLGVPFLFVFCAVDEGENRRRLRTRDQIEGAASLSDGREELWERQRQEFEIPQPQEGAFIVDASQPLEEQAERVLKALGNFARTVPARA